MPAAPYGSSITHSEYLERNLDIRKTLMQRLEFFATHNCADATRTISDALISDVAQATRRNKSRTSAIIKASFIVICIRCYSEKCPTCDPPSNVSYTASY